MERVVRFFTVQQYAFGIILTGCLFCAAPVTAGVITATTADGRSVRLHEDKTWEFVPSDEETAEDKPEPTLVLTIENKREFPNSCRFGLRLNNNSQYEVFTLVPKVSVYLSGDVRFETRVVGFNSIKPTKSQYKDVEFRNITCDMIESLKVHGGDRCDMDELNKFTPVKGECLARVQLVPSEFITWSK